jgi:hypothetical protein
LIASISASLMNQMSLSTGEAFAALAMVAPVHEQLSAAAQCGEF